MAGSIAAVFHALKRPVFFECGRISRCRCMAMEEPEQDPKSPEDARLTSLNQRLKQAQLEEAARNGRPDVARSRQVVRSAGMRILQDLVGLPMGGFVVGWVLDRLFGTLPWLTLAMLFLGFGVAVRNVMRIAKQGSNEPEGS